MLKGPCETITRRTALVLLAALVVTPASQARAAWPERPVKFAP